MNPDCRVEVWKLCVIDVVYFQTVVQWGTKSSVSFVGILRNAVIYFVVLIDISRVIHMEDCLWNNTKYVKWVVEPYPGQHHMCSESFTKLEKSVDLSSEIRVLL